MKRNNIIALGALVASIAMPSFAATEMDALRDRLAVLESQMQADTESGISIGGVIEVEYGFEDLAAGNDENEITLATAELGFAATLNDNFGAYLTLLYEQGENGDNIAVDEAVLTGQTIDGKYTFAVGRQYVPFGVYETAAISDPVGLDIGETNDEAIVLGANFSSGIGVSIWAADSGADGNNSGISLSYESDAFNAGVDWIEQVVEANGERGIAVHALVPIGDFTLIAEHVSETDGANEASATQIELDYAVSEDLTLALAHNNIDNVGDYDSSVTLAAEYVLAEGATIAAEYKTQDRTDNTGDDDVVTLRLAYEF